jgi:hypothetical protein
VRYEDISVAALDETMNLLILTYIYSAFIRNNEQAPWRKLTASTNVYAAATACR